ncbi:membrane hypothetical protein [Gammaproteobacteria bacterium]
MKNTDVSIKEEQSKNLSITYFIGIWAIYAILYYLLKTYLPNNEYAGLLATTGDTTLNIIMALFAFWLWKNATKEAKRPFGFFVLSFSFVIIPNALYQILFNILHIKASFFSTTNTELVIHHLIYACCLLFEFAAWACILAYSFSGGSKSKYKTYGMVVLIIGIILSSFLSAFAWKNNHAELSSSKCFEIYITSFYVANFTLAMLCLNICKKRSLFYLSLGYLVIVGADLIMAIGFMSQNFGTGSLFDTNRVLGLLLMLYGFLHFKKDGDYNFTPMSWLSESSDMKTQTAL